MYNKPTDWITKEITVKSIAEFEVPATGSKGTNITDENGDKYTIWHNTQEGSFSKAYSKFQGVKEGDKIEINFEEKPAKKEGFTNRTIRTVKKDFQKNPNGTLKTGQVNTIDEYNDAMEPF